ncbi:MAG: flagellar filament capping protein FliD [Sphingopyxis sp.]
MESITSALGAGSGIDIATLVDRLASAARKPKDDQFTRRTTANQARLQALADISSSLSGFSDALNTLVSGGALAMQPTSSDSAALSVNLVRGAHIAQLASEIEVISLAKSQTLQSLSMADSVSPIGQGTLSLQTAGGTVDIVIGAQNDTLSGLASSINAAQAEVKASIITDSSGARLVLRGESGAAKAFTLSVASGTATGLERFAFAPGAAGGMLLAQGAADAALKIDGIAMTSATNSVSNAISGVTIDLKRAAPGTIIAIGSSRNAGALEQGLRDFVDAYNQISTQIDEAGRNSVGSEAGPLRGDTGLNDLRRRLASLIDTPLLTSGNGPRSLSEIGIKTNRDGTLSVDTPRLTSQLASNADGIEALFSPAQRSSTALVSIQSAAARVAPGTYAITDIVPASGSTPASAMIDGIAMTAIDDRLIAPSSSPAVGLIVQIFPGASAAATIVIDGGLSGTLAAIKNTLVSPRGAFSATRDRMNREATAIGAERALHEARSTRYKDRLLTTYAAMDRRVAAFKATQSYLEQQVALWTRNNG